MFSVGGVPCPVVDAQVHIWDASPHNQAAPDGEVYALDLLRRHRELDGGRGCRRSRWSGSARPG